MAEFSPPLHSNLDIPDPIEAARRLSVRVKAYEARTASMLKDQARQFSTVHRHFLETRQQSLSDLAQLIKTDIRQFMYLPESLQPHPITRESIYSLQQLEEFATGNIENCFGPVYSVYRGRRSPRIPNGRLMLMSRVTALEGEPGVLSAGSIEVEYDCPPQPWFFDTNLISGIPNAVIMEIALQPCGFLSAYLQTPLVNSLGDLYFRNLDGQSTLLRGVQLRGTTITTRAKLVETTLGAGMILQKFTFELLCGGSVFYSGDASFGYFPAAALASQTGLDGSISHLPWKKLASSGTIINYPYVEATSNPLETGFNSIEISPTGGSYRLGYLYARKTINPAEWYFKAHFHQDPVMPGSLGVEALYSALRILVPAIDTSFTGASPALPDHKTAKLEWKYRGQVLQSNREMEFEIHLCQVEKNSGDSTFVADGSAWVDGKRIYDIKNISLKYPL